MNYQYYNTQILLVINPAGMLRILHTPIRVQVHKDNSWVYVDRILSNDRDELLFMTNGIITSHDQFRVVIHF